MKRRHNNNEELRFKDSKCSEIIMGNYNADKKVEA